MDKLKIFRHSIVFSGMKWNLTKNNESMDIKRISDLQQLHQEDCQKYCMMWTKELDFEPIALLWSIYA